MRLWIYGLFMAWGMFLAIPCPFPKWDEAARGRMLACLPLVGCVVGLLWALLSRALGLFDCPPFIRALLLSALPWAVTGFIHLDGFMDVCDAVLSRRDIETRRRILKDPHCGAFAVISIILLMLGTFAVFISDEGGARLLPLALIPVSTRASAGIAVLGMKPMEGSQYSGGQKSNWLFVLPALALAAACVVPTALYGLAGLAPLAAAAGYWAFALYGAKQLGGISGDISGFALTLGEFFGAAVLVFVR